MTLLDWMIVFLAVSAALAGWERGLLFSALSLLLAVGVVFGLAQALPYLLDQESLWVPLVALFAAVVVVLSANRLVARALARLLERRLASFPFFRLVNGTLGALLGVMLALLFVWLLTAVWMGSGELEARRYVQSSLVLRHLNDALPPARLLSVLRRFDALPEIAGPLVPLDEPDRSVLKTAGVKRASTAVVAVSGEACGWLTSGSGWVVEPGWVVTNAHVVAGHDETTVRAGGHAYAAVVYAFDVHDDLALLRVSDLAARPLPRGSADQGESAVVLGYPEGGPLHAEEARVARARVVISEDAYGRPAARRVVPIKGEIRHGNSGGPVVDAHGRVLATVFGARPDSDGGYGVPVAAVDDLLAERDAPVPVGPCLAP